MSVLRSFRTVKASFPSGSWPYIDTPDFSYDQWLTYLGGNGQAPIGTVTNSPTVAIIGAGVSGLCAAYELMRAGCAVTVFEQARRTLRILPICARRHGYCGNGLDALSAE